MGGVSVESETFWGAMTSCGAGRGDQVKATSEACVIKSESQRRHVPVEFLGW